MALDERLRRELERAGRPADPSGIYEDLIRRRERRRIAGAVRTGLLTLVVLAGTGLGLFGLIRTFGVDRDRTAAEASNGSIVFTNFDARYAIPEVTAGWHLYTMTADGTDVRFLGPREVDEALYPSVSPDGERVAFVGYVAEPEERALYVLDLSDGSVSKIFTLEADHQVGDLEWSPDGNSIGMLYTKLVWTEPPPDAGARDFDLIKTIWTISPDGSNLRQVTTVGREDGFTWSPDGTRIAFSRHAPIDGDQRFVPNDIYVVDADGTNEIKLTDDGVSMAPAWSPDGTMIAFESYQPTEEPNVDLYVMLADGTGRRRLTDDPGNEFGAAWSPDGALVVYAERAVMVDNTSSCYISVVALDGSRSNRLFGMRDVDGCPGQNGISWQALPASGTPAEPERTQEPGRSEQDIGLGFPVCNVTSVGGAFESGVTGTAYVATKASDTVCPQPGDGMQVLAVDINADGLADTSYGPLECDRWCTAYAAPDVDEDGTDELLVQNIEFSIIGLTLFEVQSGDGGAAIGPVTVAPPGDPAAGFEPGAIPQLWLGGDAFSLDTLRCGTLDAPVGPGLVYTSAESLPHDSPDAEWNAHEVTFVLRNWELHVVDVREFKEPVGTGPPSFQSHETLCGSNLGPSQA